MVTLTLLAQFAILYVLIVFVWRLPILFRLLLGLIITWPTLGLYGELPLPAGIPDLNFQRGYVAVLVLGYFMSVVLEKRQSAKSPIDQTEAPRDVGVPHFYQDVSPTFPIWVAAYVGLKAVSVVNGLVFGTGGSTSITGYIETTLIAVVAYFLVKRFVDSRERLMWLLGAIILSALIILGTGVYERVLNLDESIFPVSAHNEAGNTRTMDVPGGRAAGVIGNSAVFGGLMGMSLLATLCIGVNAKKTWLKISLGCIAMILAYGVFVCFTRSAWLSVAIALGFSQFYFNGLWKLTVPIGFVVTFALLIVWGSLAKSDVVQGRLLNQETVTGRVERFVWSWQRFLERPIIGRGPGSLNKLMQAEYSEDGFDTSHNTYMTMMVDNGGLVFICFWGVVFGWLSKAKSILLLQDRKSIFFTSAAFERSVVAAMVGCITIYLLAGMSLEISYFSYYTVMFWIAGAVIERMVGATGTTSEKTALEGTASADR
ncbi:O-Antigen ligase [Planctomycetes bacterium CA13]|uniref:O-Antigen ligase n=1 Tax=Novipirellula herctigrandis TaxID=2527986 RepID=A0A5C5Z503_9BACT|nr:O-Antigen ligase [Planctomycetes bacterium CA13]